MSTPAYDTVRLARANKRPTGLDYIHNLCADFFELHGIPKDTARPCA